MLRFLLVITTQCVATGDVYGAFAGGRANGGGAAAAAAAAAHTPCTSVTSGGVDVTSCLHVFKHLCAVAAGTTSTTTNAAAATTTTASTVDVDCIRAAAADPIKHSLVIGTHSATSAGSCQSAFEALQRTHGHCRVAPEVDSDKA